MKKLRIVGVMCLLGISVSSSSQQRPAGMSAAEMEGYKQKVMRQAEAKMKKMAADNQVAIDETLMPGEAVTLPVKDVKRLASLPAVPPRKDQLLLGAALHERSLIKVIDPATVAATTQQTNSMTAADLHAAAIAAWYNHQPQQALLLALKSVQKAPDSTTGWNNLAAMYNLTGLEQLAVPILRYCLQVLPGSSIVRNNLGQAYLGMGDVATAKQFFGECLSIDPAQPEANQAMGVISMVQQDPVSAVRYFEKELRVANRKSSLAYLVKSGQREKINLAALRKQRMEAQGVPQRNFFGDIAFDKFDMPEFPSSCLYSEKWQQQSEYFVQSVSVEYNFWLQFATAAQTDEEKRLAIHYNPALYSELVDELLLDLDKEYLPYLQVSTQETIQSMAEMQADYARKLMAIKCPEPKGDEVYNAEVMRAYDKKCCDLTKPVIDQFMAGVNGALYNRYRSVNGQWKQYLNTMISFVQLDPSPANKRKVYLVFSQYFAFLTSVVGLVAAEDLPGGCRTGLTAAKADSIILVSKRRLELFCPSWLQFKQKVGIATIKGSCETFGVEVEFAKIMKAGFEKTFKTGASTLYMGPHLGVEIAGTEAALYQELYFVFDRNNQFADAGIRGGAKTELPFGVGEVNAGYDMSISSGFKPVSKNTEWIDQLSRAVSAGSNIPAPRGNTLSTYKNQ